MDPAEARIPELLTALTAAVDRFTTAARAIDDPERIATGDWPAWMVVAHVTFWHESFARNLSDLAAGRRPSPHAGSLAALAERARTEAAGQDIGALLDRLAAAQLVITRDIGTPGIGLIPYRRGSRAYPPAKHLEVTCRHVTGHTRDLARVIGRDRI